MVNAIIENQDEDVFQYFSMHVYLTPYNHIMSGKPTNLYLVD